MSRFRVPKKGSEFYIPEREYHTVVNFCLCYPGWKTRLAVINATLRDYKSPDASVSAVQIDGMPHGTNVGDPTEKTAERNVERYYDLIRERDRVRYKVRVIEDITRRVCGDILFPYIMKGITEGQPYYRLEGIPVTDKEYGKIRRNVYFEISKRI